jgi:FKBP-type peptidyl-prolyl cis-trans isomerase
MKKENRRLAQERRAKERAKQERAARVKKVLPPVIVIAVIAIVVIATVASSVKNKNSQESVSGSSASSSSLTSSAASSDSTGGETLNKTAGIEVKSGDTVNIDYTGTIDGEEFDGGSTNGQGTDLVLGSGSYIDGFEDGIIGHKVGETFDVNVTFPENYGVDSLNGKDAVFSVTINGVYQ